MFLKILLLVLLLGTLAPAGFAEEPAGSPSKAANTETLGENEHLSFMQSEQNPDPQEPSSSGLLLKTLGSMLLIVGLIFFGAWGAKKLGFGGSKSSNSADDVELKILSTVSVGSGRSMSTVRFGGRVLLVGSTTNAFTLLAEEKGNDYAPLQNSRLVADMLAEENASFGNEFEKAREKLGGWDATGESI
jgi:flagellar biogenesis protein FliO